MSDNLREVGKLPRGVKVGEMRHRDFELQLPTVQDNIDAVDEVGSHNGVALNAAILSRQLTKLGSLKPEEINFELVAGMHPADYNALEAAAERLEKKHVDEVENESASSESASPSSAPV